MNVRRIDIMAMKNFRQLKEDAAANKELAKKLEEADREFHKSDDMNAFIKAAAELGYEVTEQDISVQDELVKLDEEELDNVAGGAFGFGTKAPDGHEIGCIFSFSYYVGPNSFCPNNYDDGHEYVFVGLDPEDEDYELYQCKHCGYEIFEFIGGAVE